MQTTPRPRLTIFPHPLPCIKEIHALSLELQIPYMNAQVTSMLETGRNQNKDEFDGGRLAKSITRKRQSLGLTIEELADRADIHPALLETYESGWVPASCFPKKYMAFVAEALGCTLSDLVQS